MGCFSTWASITGQHISTLSLRAGNGTRPLELHPHVCLRELPSGLQLHSLHLEWFAFSCSRKVSLGV